MDSMFLPGVPADQVMTALSAAGGNEITSGKFASPQSSAALAVNAFGWFLERANTLPLLPGLNACDWPALRVDLERQMRLPWRGGRHPWLDAAIETKTTLIGVESKRFEPFRDRKRAKLSDAYDRDVWGDEMQPFKAIRDRLRADHSAFRFLDAAQLVKHALGLVTEGKRCNKRPILYYLYAEPTEGRSITEEQFRQHRAEIAVFAQAVHGAAVQFAAGNYRDWLACFAGPARRHATKLVERFHL